MVTKKPCSIPVSMNAHACLYPLIGRAPIFPVLSYSQHRNTPLYEKSDWHRKFLLHSGRHERASSWYQKHLGLEPEGNSLVFKWRGVNKPEETGHIVLALFPNDTKYFQPSEKAYMINLRVENLAQLLDVLRKEGVKVDDRIEEYEYGKFGWIMDPEGNRIELWDQVTRSSDPGDRSQVTIARPGVHSRAIRPTCHSDVTLQHHAVPGNQRFLYLPTSSARSSTCPSITFSRFSFAGYLSPWITDRAHQHHLR
jgi:predicted enzyme related to lactoylglutathione lyase